MDILLLLKQFITSDGSMLGLLGLSFLAGILISFTPCVYPMIPITIGIMQTQTAHSVWRGFVTGLFYVLGLATVYATLGFISASTSVVFGQWTSSPYFIIFTVFLFLYLAFSLFGFYEITVPRFFTERVAPVQVAQPGQSQPGQSQPGPRQSKEQQVKPVPAARPFLKSFLMGLFAGTIASPCITPALAMLLTLVAQRGNPFLGFLALFVFAFGMGFLLIFVGMFSVSINVLPRAGEWMNEVKKLFGFMMLAICVYMSRHLLPILLSTCLYAAICASASIYYFYTGYFASDWAKIIKWLLAVCFLFGTVWLVVGIF
jgi:thiol:disulfide interchange protein DsbD